LIHGSSAAAIEHFVPDIGWVQYEEFGNAYLWQCSAFTEAGFTCCSVTEPANWIEGTVITVENRIVENYCCATTNEPWDAGTTYALGELVFSGGYVWRSKQNGNLNHAIPFADDAWWETYTPSCQEVESNNCPDSEDCEPLDAP
jgi:hypothetical protein